MDMMRPAPSPCPKSGEERPYHRGRSAHADGGATGVKKRFSLAARHRFFGQAPKKWGRMAGQGNDHRPAYRRTRTKCNKNKRGNPRRGFPLRPPPALYEAQERSALCVAQAGALPLHPAAFEKAGETFIRASRSGGRVISRGGGRTRRRARAYGTQRRWS